MKPVGYLLNNPEGLEGEPGIYLNYTLAANGLFVEAQSKLITARVPVAECEVRGLAPLETKVSLLYGSIPQRFFDLALSRFLADTTREHYVGVIGDAGYRFYVPAQSSEPGHVVYDVGDSVILDIHSHGTMTARFSPQDNEDEQGLKLYGVVGNLGSTPVVKLRVGVYGYFHPLTWRDVFDGSLGGAIENEREEVISIDELQGIPGEHDGQLSDHSRGLWGDWWFRR